MFVSNNGTNGVVGGTIGAADATARSASTVSASTTQAHGADGGRDDRDRHHARSARCRARSVPLENRLSYAIGLAQSQIVNTKAAESRIRDANIAEESANLTRFNILNQSGIAALAQANQRRRPVLSLLR